MDFQRSSGESERASSCPLGDFSKRKRSPSTHLSCPPTPLVVVPDLSCSTLWCETSSRQKSNRSQYSERMVEDPHESDSRIKLSHYKKIRVRKVNQFLSRVSSDYELRETRSSTLWSSRRHIFPHYSQASR